MNTRSTKIFNCHFCSRRKAAKFCHPGSEWNWICQSLLARSHAVLSMCSIDSHFALSPDTVVYGYSWYLFDNEYALLLWPLWCSSTILICKIFLWEMNKRFRTLEIFITWIAKMTLVQGAEQWVVGAGIKFFYKLNFTFLQLGLLIHSKLRLQWLQKQRFGFRFRLRAI